MCNYGYLKRGYRKLITSRFTTISSAVLDKSMSYAGAAPGFIMGGEPTTSKASHSLD